MKQFTISNQLTAICKRLAMVLTVLFTLGVGNMWGADTWELVTDASTLKAGDELVLVSDDSNDYVAGDISSSVMASVDVTISNNKTISSLPNTAKILTLGGSSGAWTLTNSSGKKLGATAVKKVAWDSGTTTWSISISNNNATIQSTTSSYGRFLYNVNSPRFTTYTSDPTSSMLLPQLYRKKASCTEPTVAWKTAPADGEIGNTMTVSVTTNYSAGLKYSSSNTNVATIDNSGIITYEATGSTTITATVTGDGNTYCDKTVTVTKTINVTCGSKVTINTTSDGNGTITINKTPIETCSDNDGDRQITITLNPNSHYSSNAPTISGITNATITGSSNTYIVQLPEGSNGTLSVSASFKEDDKYTVIWSADDATIDTEQVYVNEKVSVVPTISDIPEENRCGDKFVGWTTEAIPTPQDDAPSYFTTAANSPAITSDITFYAVFADYAD